MSINAPYGIQEGGQEVPYGGQEGVRMCQSNDLGWFGHFVNCLVCENKLLDVFEQLKRKTNKQTNK